MINILWFIISFAQYNHRSIFYISYSFFSVFPLSSFFVSLFFLSIIFVFHFIVRHCSFLPFSTILFKSSVYILDAIFFDVTNKSSFLSNRRNLSRSNEHTNNSYFYIKTLKDENRWKMESDLLCVWDTSSCRHFFLQKILSCRYLEYRYLVLWMPLFEMRVLISISPIDQLYPSVSILT